MSTGSNDKQLALFKSSYKPFVLAALSGETAVFSHTTAEVDGKLINWRQVIEA